jgi:hypothetical protein
MTAISGLLGVLVGGWLTARNQKRERQIKFLRETLTEFYGPMLAMQQQVLAKAELREKIDSAASSAWARLVESKPKGTPLGADFEPFNKIFEENNRQLAEEIFPVYRKMVQGFMDKLHFADVSTIAYLQDLIGFVEIWDRYIRKSIPVQVIPLLQHSSESVLKPLYRDLASHFLALQAELNERHSWWRRREVSATIKVEPEVDPSSNPRPPNE